MAVGKGLYLSGSVCAHCRMGKGTHPSSKGGCKAPLLLEGQLEGQHHGKLVRTTESQASLSSLTAANI